MKQTSRAAALLLIGGLWACPSEPKPETTDKAQPTKAALTPADPASKPADMEKIELPPGDGPVATVGGTGIPRDVFNREYIQTIERYQRARHDVKPALRERLKDNIVRRLVDAEVIAQTAKTMAVEVSPDEQKTKWEEHKKRYGDEAAFKAFLERAGTSEEDVKRQFESNLVREKVFAKVSEAVAVTPAEIEEFYGQNQARYDEPEQIRASHILIRLPPGATPEVKAEKKKKAEEVLKLTKKQKFEDLAKEFGEDPTKDTGGDLRWFGRNKMVKAFEDAAWPMKTNQISGIVETQFGFHIIKKTDYRPARKKPFAEVKEQIERSLQARKRNTAIREALDKWKAEAKIEIFVKGDPEIIAAGRAKPITGQKPEMVPPGGRPMLTPGIQIQKLDKPVTTDQPVHP